MGLGYRGGLPWKLYKTILNIEEIMQSLQWPPGEHLKN